MPRKNGRRDPMNRRVYFRMSDPAASEVALVGTFIGWNPGARVLKSDGKGTWRTYVTLKPGTYEYRFLVDGEWRNDSDSVRVPNAYGTENCLRVVS